jgi:hypothetical protein
MNKRRRMVGKVTSNKMMKTVVVEIVRNPAPPPKVSSMNRVKAHDELSAGGRRGPNRERAPPGTSDGVETVLGERSAPPMQAYGWRRDFPVETGERRRRGTTS